jgi:uncharacterized protein (TIGR03067 family)
MTMRIWIRKLTLAFALPCLALLAGLSTHTVIADEAAQSPALKAIQGVWATSENDNVDAKWDFKGDSLKVTVNGMDYAGKIKLDDKAKPYSTLDFDLTEAPEDSKGKTAKAIYKLEGEKLIISVSTPGHDRPRDFEPVPDEVHLFELKKQKKN